jgi:hypothetical protein
VFTAPTKLKCRGGGGAERRAWKVGAIAWEGARPPERLVATGRQRDATRFVRWARVVASVPYVSLWLTPPDGESVTVDGGSWRLGPWS